MEHGEKGSGEGLLGEGWEKTHPPIWGVSQVFFMLAHF